MERGLVTGLRPGNPCSPELVVAVMKVPEPVEYATWALFRRFWTWGQWLRHPRDNWGWRRKWRCRPATGAWVEDCRGQVHQVTGFGETDDDLLLDDGTRASWTHCCNFAQAPGEATGEP